MRVRGLRVGLAGVVMMAASLVSGVARGAEPALPPGMRLRGTVETDGIREVPELKGARINRERDESVRGVRVLDQTWDGDIAYRDAVRFYDRALGHALVIERDEADTTTGWLVRLDDGSVESVVVRNTRPTSIEIQRVAP